MNALKVTTTDLLQDYARIIDSSQLQLEATKARMADLEKQLAASRGEVLVARRGYLDLLVAANGAIDAWCAQDDIVSGTPMEAAIDQLLAVIHRGPVPEIDIPVFIGDAE